MKAKYLALLCAFFVAVAVSVAHAQQPVDSWQGGWRQYIGSKTGGAIWADTLGMLSSDSVATTDSIPVAGKRGIYLLFQSDGVGASQYDSTAIPIMQVSLNGGQWQAVGGAYALPQLTGNLAVGIATTLVNQRGVIMLYLAGNVESGGTPHPFTQSWMRFRLKSSNARRYATASSATLAPSGTIRVRAFLLP